MTATKAVRWWPLVGLVGMALLGLAVRSGPTALDSWFTAVGEQYPQLGGLLFFTDPRVLVVVWSTVLALAVIRRPWRFAAVVVVMPLLAVLAARFFKRLFGRYRDEALAYPSGHTTLALVVFGLAVLVAGAAVWAVALAMAASVLAALGQAVTYHYFTDTIGAILLATALVCLAAGAAELDRCQPRCDLRHSNG